MCVNTVGQMSTVLGDGHITPRAADGPLAVLSAGSDGIDGESDAAGAIVDQHTTDCDATRASALRALAEFDSSSWLSAVGATVVTGATGHNLRDLRILLAGDGW